jgi:uncharacterized protein YhbP (UPF0306 family)
MDGVERRVRELLKNGSMMQLATVSGGQPWCCTVFFVSDENLNIYWISTPERRHSQEIHSHTKVAAAFPMQHVPGKSVVGIQMGGEAIQVVDSDEMQRMIHLYADKYKIGDSWRVDFIAGKNSHKLYRITPNEIVLFDEEKFPNDPRQVMKMK